MTLIDWLILAALLIAVVIAVLHIRKKRGSCCGDCTNCSECTQTKQKKK